MLSLLPTCAILALGLFQAVNAVPFQGLNPRGLTTCQNYNTDFTSSTKGWVADVPEGEAWQITNEGLQST